jgi:hypothetical protein
MGMGNSGVVGMVEDYKRKSHVCFLRERERENENVL